MPPAAIENWVDWGELHPSRARIRQYGGPRTAGRSHGAHGRNLMSPGSIPATVGDKGIGTVSAPKHGSAQCPSSRHQSQEGMAAPSGLGLDEGSPTPCTTPVLVQISMPGPREFEARRAICAMPGARLPQRTIHNANHTNRRYRVGLMTQCITQIIGSRTPHGIQIGQDPGQDPKPSQIHHTDPESIAYTLDC